MHWERDTMILCMRGELCSLNNGINDIFRL